MASSFDLKSGDPDDFDVDIYEMSSLKALAETFVDEGLFGKIPENLVNYLDYDALARDLGMDYSEITIAGTRLIYRCSRFQQARAGNRRGQNLIASH